MRTATPPEPVWTFTRGADRLVVRCPFAARLVITSTDNVSTRFIDFADAEDRVQYQSNLESHLIATGWSLLHFSAKGDDPAGLPVHKRGWLSRVLIAGSRFRRRSTM